MPFFSHNHFWNLVKAQAPLNDYGEIYLDLFSFVRRQAELAFFGALTAVDALFILYGSFGGKENGTY